ncbi:MAG: gluconate 2-dehydrogenase subunit 3 family protein [Cyclobacteriaceae bacterium]|nr:gluconate 2-dehydrogenase subunit 3 family protein [Cyclobacteriaceae bacterium]
MNRRTVIKRSSLALSAAFTPGLISSLLSSCKSKEQVSFPELKFLTQDEYQSISSIVDIILPATSTPGGLECGVMDIFDLIITDCVSEEDKKIFRSGLSNISNASGEEFKDLDREKQIQVISDLDGQTSNDEDVNKAYHTIKDLSLKIYFTSEKGINAHFDYKPVPGKYSGCDPYKEGDKVWLSSLV